MSFFRRIFGKKKDCTIEVLAINEALFPLKEEMLILIDEIDSLGKEMQARKNLEVMIANAISSLDSRIGAIEDSIGTISTRLGYTEKALTKQLSRNADEVVVELTEDSTLD